MFSVSLSLFFLKKIKKREGGEEKIIAKLMNINTLMNKCIFLFFETEFCFIISKTEHEIYLYSIEE